MTSRTLFPGFTTITRRAAVAAVLSLLAAPLAAAQQAGKVYRVGVLWLNSLQADSHLLEALRRGLREFVGVEERNIVIEFRSAEGNPDKLPGLVAELVRIKADVLVVDTTPAIQAAMRGTSTVPIVMAIAADPVGSGLVSSSRTREGTSRGSHSCFRKSARGGSSCSKKSFRGFPAWPCSGIRTPVAHAHAESR